jgi:hypothetical protein
MNQIIPGMGQSDWAMRGRSLAKFGPNEEQHGDKRDDGDIETPNTHATLLIDTHFPALTAATFAGARSLGDQAALEANSSRFRPILLLVISKSRD